MITRALRQLGNGLARLRLGRARRTPSDVDNNSYIVTFLPEEEKKIARHAPLSSELSTRFEELTAALVVNRNRLVRIEDMNSDSPSTKIFLNVALVGELVSIGLCVSGSLVPVAAITVTGSWIALISVSLDIMIGICCDNSRVIASEYHQHLAPDIEIGFAYDALKNTTEEKIQDNQNELLKIKNDALMSAEFKIENNALIAAEFRLFATAQKIATPIQDIVLEYAELIDKNTQYGAPSYLKS
ncbi:MAG: hypothetical protein ABI370_00995 [Gammaproteobacteria bacterium]